MTTPTRGEGGQFQRIADHHASEYLQCDACREPWPCQEYEAARRRLAKRGERPTVIHVEKVT